MKTTEHHLAVVTGASSGIGKAFAGKLAEMGYDLVITGRRREKLELVASLLRAQHGVLVEILCGDLSEPGHRDKLARKLRRSGGTEVLVNNAGFGIDKSFSNMSLDEITSMMTTTNLASMELVHAVLPGMIARHRGVIINVSSLCAFLPGLSENVYLAAKAFLHQLSVGLNIELAGSGIYVQSLCPGFVRSDFHRLIEETPDFQKFQHLGFMSPEEVVRASFRAAAKGVMICIPGWWNRVFYVTARLLPVGTFRVLSRFRGNKAHKLVPVLGLPQRALQVA